MTLTLMIILKSWNISWLSQKNAASNSQDNQFYKSDLDRNLDIMTLVLKLDLDMVKIYHHTKN